jgi:hypothetical protein
MGTHHLPGVTVRSFFPNPQGQVTLTALSWMMRSSPAVVDAAGSAAAELHDLAQPAQVDILTFC